MMKVSELVYSLNDLVIDEFCERLIEEEFRIAKPIDYTKLTL